MDRPCGQAVLLDLALASDDHASQPRTPAHCQRVCSWPGTTVYPASYNVPGGTMMAAFMQTDMCGHTRTAASYTLH
eukprot:329259-Chlamydomonas_euryale.AAC.7